MPWKVSSEPALVFPSILGRLKAVYLMSPGSADSIRTILYIAGPGGKTSSCLLTYLLNIFPLLSGLS